MANRILVYQDGQRLGIEGTSTGQVLSWNDSSGAWELSTPSGSGTVTSITAGTGLTGGVITSSGTIAADFGTGSGKIAEGNDSRFPPAPSAAGRLIYDTGSAWTALAAGTEGKVLTAHGAAAPTWETPAASGVTSITAGTGLSGGTITTSGTIALAALDPAPTGSYGSASSVAAITVDAYGRVTSASSTAIAIAASAITSGQLGVAYGGTGLASAGGVANRAVYTADGSTFTVGTLPNEALANSAITVTAGTGIAVSGSPVALGGSVTVSTATDRTLPAAGTQGRVLYDNGTAWAALNPGTSGQFLQTQGASANPQWASGNAGTVTSITAGTGLSGGTITGSGTIAADFGTTSGKIAQGNDSRFNPAPSAAGGLSYDTGTGYTALALGTVGKFLKAGASTPSWESITASDVSGVATSGANSNITSLSGLTTALSVGQGGTGATTLPQYAVVLGNATSAVATAAPGASGQVLTSNGASANPSFQALPYDVSGEAAGTPAASTTIFHFKAARAWTLKASGSVAGCDVSPTGANVSYTISKAGSPIGTIDFTTGGTNTVTITGGVDVAFAIGEVLTVTTPSDLKTMEAPFWTFLGTCP